MSRRMVRILVVGASVILSVATERWYFSWGRPEVRPLIVKGASVNRLPVPDQVTVFRSLDSFRTLTRCKDPLALANVDFKMHDVVRVGWQADGPNFGTLQFVERLSSQSVLFYVDCPPSDYRTFSRKVDEGWFLVPKGAHVVLFQYPHIVGLDMALLLAAAAPAVLALLIVRRGKTERILAAERTAATA